MNYTDFDSTTADLGSVIECRSFKTADAKYQELVAVSVREDWRFSKRNSDFTDPSQLSEIESDIFNIDESYIPALFWAYIRYENLMGCQDEYFGEFVDIERREYPDFYHDGEWCFGQAVGFMITTCKLPQPECMAWVCKIVAAQVRGGLYHPYTH